MARLAVGLVLLLVGTLVRSENEDAYLDEDDQQFTTRKLLQQQQGDDNNILNMQLNITGSNPPPPPAELARMARYVAHNCDWASIASTSTMPSIPGIAFSNVLSVSDGPVQSGSGIPYFYMTPLDITAKDLAVDRRCSVSMSLAQTDYCKQQSLDPEDPRCAHLILTGEMWKLKNGTKAAKKAEDAMFSRHTIMKTWPKDHDFYFAALKIQQIILLDNFGGAKFIPVNDYFNVTP